MEKSSLESFLWTGTTLAILRAGGKTPEVNDILKISTSWKEISFLSNYSILVGMLLGPTDLVESSEDMMRAISSLSVGLKKEEFWAQFFRKSEKCLWEYLIFTLFERQWKKNNCWKH